MYRLREQIEVVAFFASLLQQIGRRRLSREQQGLTLRLRLAKMNCQLYSCHARHHNVADEEIGSRLCARVNGLLRMIKSDCLESDLTQDNSKRLGNYHFLIKSDFVTKAKTRC